MKSPRKVDTATSARHPGLHRAAPVAVAAGAPALLFLSVVLGPACEGCLPIAQMAYFLGATFVSLPVVAFLAAINRLWRTQWSLAALSSATSVLLTTATILGF
jgi:hypothetical protein